MARSPRSLVGWKSHSSYFPVILHLRTVAAHHWIHGETACTALHSPSSSSRRGKKLHQLFLGAELLIPGPVPKSRCYLSYQIISDLSEILKGLLNLPDSQGSDTLVLDFDPVWFTFPCWIHWWKLLASWESYPWDSLSSNDNCPHFERFCWPKLVRCEDFFFIKFIDVFYSELLKLFSPSNSRHNDVNRYLQFTYPCEVGSQRGTRRRWSRYKDGLQRRCRWDALFRHRGREIIFICGRLLPLFSKQRRDEVSSYNCWHVMGISFTAFYALESSGMWIIFDFSKCSSPDSEFAPKKTSKNGAPTRISEPMSEQWIDPTAREIKVGEVNHLRLDATAATLFIIFESKDKAEWCFVFPTFPWANATEQLTLLRKWTCPMLSQGHIEFTAIPADRTDEPNRTIELEWVDRIWSTRECVQHVDAYAQIGACWNRRFTTKLLRRTCKRLEISGTNSDNGKGRRYCTHPQLLNYCCDFICTFG